MLASLNAEQIEETRAFMELEYIGDERADFRTALQTAAMLNGWGAKPKIVPSRFMLFTDKPKPTDVQLMEKAKRILPETKA